MICSSVLDDTSRYFKKVLFLGCETDNANDKWWTYIVPVQLLHCCVQFCFLL